MKVEVDQYEVRHKQRIFTVFKYPNIQDCWLYDDHPAEESYDCSGSTEAMKLFASCFALSISNPKAVIWLPIKKNDDIAGTTFHMVLTQPYLEGFKPSVWYKMKHSMRKGKRYVFQYDEQALMNYVDEVIEPSYDIVKWKKDQRSFQQKELGDTIFCQYSVNDLYRFHKTILDAVESAEEQPDRVSFGWSLGWVYTESFINYLLKGE